ncbi:MAG TPA: VCBS repeat-containing protein, partial [Planctomycetota bacterium]|nr:VCBS repeat-containing protein [Planctomycetota bacterium]
MRFPILTRHTFTCALGLLLGLHGICLGQDCNQNGRADDQDIAPAHIAFGALEELEVVASGDTPWSSAVGDFNSDGSMDVVVASDKGRVYLVLNKGVGAFNKPLVIANARFPSDITALDFDQDGATDIAYWDGGEPAIVILRNLGGGFADPEKYTITSQFPLEHLAAADLDGDDAPELLIAGGYKEGRLFILRNDGGGSFESKAYTIARSPRRPLVGDMDGDGYPDIFIVSDEDRSSQFLKNQGDATFAPARLIALEPPSAFPTMAADFDGDKDIDLAGGRFVFHNDGQANFGAGELINVELSMRSPLVEDVDGDK